MFVGIGKESIEEKYSIALEKESVPKTNVIIGVVASKGKATGRVAVIMGHKDISKIKPGDILVSPMTMPDFVSAMEKAAAIVTDEGGITCHAAIVARELGIPCIVGTKTATL